jgi:hypothetical protein
MRKHETSCWVAALILCASIATAQKAPIACAIRPTVFDGWQAQEMANDWVTLTFVPQLGGRLMQVAFKGHPYLFVNHVYEGKYISPEKAKGDWINYGGDKIWPLPEGNDDELDDGSYRFSILEEGERCKIRLEGPPDPPTGLQYTREISIGNDSPEIDFHAITKNYTGHTIDWSVQSVSQYDLSDAKDGKEFNRNFWAFAPLNPKTGYLLGYHVRDGLANDPSYRTRDGLFRLNWKYLESEVWLDSSAGWIALVDGDTQYAMVEKSHYIQSAEYPSKASVIFYKNGPTVELDAQGKPHLSTEGEADSQAKTPYYMEAELNSPMAELAPGETYTFDTTWFPSRMTPKLKKVTDAGIVGELLTAKRSGEKIELTGSFGVFYPGKLKALFYDRGGNETSETELKTVQPEEMVELRESIAAPDMVKRVSVHLIDNKGMDRGPLGEVFISIESESH